MMMMIFICLIRVYTLLISQLSNNVRPEGEADSAAKICVVWMDVVCARGDAMNCIHCWMVIYQHVEANGRRCIWINWCTDIFLSYVNRMSAPNSCFACRRIDSNDIPRIYKQKCIEFVCVSRPGLMNSMQCHATQRIVAKTMKSIQN